MNLCKQLEPFTGGKGKKKTRKLVSASKRFDGASRVKDISSRNPILFLRADDVRPFLLRFVKGAARKLRIASEAQGKPGKAGETTSIGFHECVTRHDVILEDLGLSSSSGTRTRRNWRRRELAANIVARGYNLRGAIDTTLCRFVVVICLASIAGINLN